MPPRRCLDELEIDQFVARMTRETQTEPLKVHKARLSQHVNTVSCQASKGCSCCRSSCCAPQLHVTGFALRAEESDVLQVT